MNMFVASMALNLLLVSIILLAMVERRYQFRLYFRNLYGKHLISKRIKLEKDAYEAAPKLEISMSTSGYTESGERFEISHWEEIEHPGGEPFVAYYYAKGDGNHIAPDSYDVGGVIWDGADFRSRFQQAMDAKIVPKQLLASQMKRRSSNRRPLVAAKGYNPSLESPRVLDALAKEYQLGGDIDSSSDTPPGSPPWVKPDSAS